MPHKEVVPKRVSFHIIGGLVQTAGLIDDVNEESALVVGRAGRLAQANGSRHPVRLVRAEQLIRGPVTNTRWPSLCVSRQVFRRPRATNGAKSACGGNVCAALMTKVYVNGNGHAGRTLTVWLAASRSENGQGFSCSARGPSTALITRVHILGISSHRLRMSDAFVALQPSRFA